MSDLTKLSNKALGEELSRRVALTGRLIMPGFGTLKRETKPARLGRNPRTGESVQIPERVVTKFKDSK